MNLHELLRDLVVRQGPGVVESAEGFRAALDDFLSEEEATTGELNLLVDAVRLGGVDRLRSIIDHGGQPQAAIAEAGDAFARDRGTDDVARCRWAVAVVGYALGWVATGDIPTGAAPDSTQAVSPPPVPPETSPPAPPPARPVVPPTEASPRTFPATEETAPPTVPSPSRRRGRGLLVVLLVAAVVAAAVLVGMQLGGDDDPRTSADRDGPRSPSLSTDETAGEPGQALPETVVVLPVTDADEVTRIWSVDVDSGEAAPLTQGPDDRVPVVSPDRRTLIYSEMPRGEPGRPMVMDLATGRTRPLLVTDGGCEYSTRPAFNPAGDRLAVVCLDELGGYVAMYVVNLRGGFEANVTVDGVPIGSPTWTSPTTLVWAQEGETESAPTTLWRGEVGGDAPEQVTDGTAGFDSHPDWSAESGLLLFSRHPGPQPFGDLLTTNIDDEPGPAAEGVRWGHPAWSPDGTRVVFTIEEGDTEVLNVATLEAGGFSDPVPVPGELTGDPGVPAWGTR